MRAFMKINPMTARRRGTDVDHAQKTQRTLFCAEFVDAENDITELCADQLQTLEVCARELLEDSDEDF